MNSNENEENNTEKKVQEDSIVNDSKKEESNVEKIENNSNNKTEQAEKNNDSDESKKKMKKEKKSKNKKNKKENKNLQDKNSENIQKDESEKIDNKQQTSVVLKKQESIDNKPQYVVDMLKKRKRIAITITSIFIIMILCIAFSTIFALLNTNSQKIIKGISIKNIDVSGLTISEAVKKVNDAINIECQESVKMQYNDYNVEIDPKNIEYKYNIEEVVKNAYKIGREGNLVQNNYTLLFSSIFKNNLELTESYNNDLLNTAITDLSSKIPGVVVEPSFYIEEEDNNLIIVRGIDGIAIEKDKLKEDIISNIKNRNAKEILDGKKIEKVQIVVKNEKAKDIDIDEIYNKVHKEPVNAYYEEEPFKLYAQVDGVDFDISIDEAKEIIKESKEEYEIPLKIIPAEITINDIGLEAFPYEISQFSTKYDVTNVNRSTNLRLASEKIDGTVLMPGDVFSYNQVVGKRTIEEGYKNAAIYVNGGVEDGLGGGICQISSTLYNAVLEANLGIVERQNHTFKTSYLNVGRDATVVYGSIDFQFENTRNYPIKIESNVSNGVATMSIYGIAEETEYEVNIVPVTTSVIPYDVEYIEDDSLAPGEERIKQYGTAGYKVTTYKELILNEVVVSNEIISNDTYSPLKRIILVGPSEVE